MTEKQEQGDAPQPAPPKDAGMPPHASPPPRSGPGEGARAPLGEWRGPAFWMACGALLTAMAAGAVVLAQRVGVERDMMAVAATMPAATPGPQAVPAARADAPPQQAAAAPAVGVAAAEPSGTTQPMPRSQEMQAARNAKAVRPPLRHPAAKAHRKLSADAIRKWRAAEEKYPEVFKRCPRPGEAGAIRCRHDICNGAEGRGPACKPYLAKARSIGR